MLRSRRRLLCLVSLLLTAGLVVVAASASVFAHDPVPPPAGSATSQPYQWARQFGTEGFDLASAVALDQEGNLYVVGYSSGALPTQSQLGFRDVYVLKYDHDGNLLWTRQMGSPAHDSGTGVAVDGSGGLYVVGSTYGNFPEKENLGGRDAFLLRYAGDGVPIWTIQFGTDTEDFATGAVADSAGNVYVVGNVSGTLPGQTHFGLGDAFVRKYNDGGNLLWTRQFGTEHQDEAAAVGMDGDGTLYIVGNTYSTFPGQTRGGLWDAYLRSYDSDGNELWTRQFGTDDDDFPESLAVDTSGNVYVAGSTWGAFPGASNFGLGDVFIRSYDRQGNELSTIQFGSGNEEIPPTLLDDAATAIAVDGDGNLYVAGWTHLFLGDNFNAGFDDLFLRKYAADGHEVWTRQFGTQMDDYPLAMVSAGEGNIYVVGYTRGALAGEVQLGSMDAFIMMLPDDLSSVLAISASKPASSPATPTPTAVARLVPTSSPTPTPAPAATRGSCGSPIGGTAVVDGAWLLLGLVAPGLALVGARRRRLRK